jgi:hypothetical protein
MKNRMNAVLIIIFAVLILLFVTFLLHGRSYIGKGRPGAGSKENAKGFYICPMHPSFTSDKPGDCIICGMKLIKKEVASKEAFSSKDASSALSVTPAPEKTLEQVCIEHNCTMKNCAMHVKTMMKPGERIICPICGEVISTTNGKVVEIIKQAVSPNKERKLIYYRNPMNPEVTSPGPMKDSMGMDYIPVYEEPAGGETGRGIMISPEKQQLIGVKTEPVQKRPLTKIVRAFGKIAYDPDLYVAQQEYLQALKAADATKNSVLSAITQQSGDLLQAAEKKLLLLGMSKEEIANLAKQGLPQENLYLPSGQNTVWIYISVYEYEIGLVRVGALVDVESVAYPGEVFQGKAVSINPVLDPATRTNQVRVEVGNPGGKLKPEMFVNAKIQVDLGEKLAVPETAVLDTGLRKIVYLSVPGDILESREITVGQKAEGYYEVLDGVKEGDIVVTSGNFLVDSESRLKSVT